ncbi:hypothetical protein D3C85_377490 [compost metagenome]
MPPQIRIMSNVHPDFYRIMGKWFGSRQAQKEIGYPIFDDADKDWYLAFDSGALVGFASLQGSVISDCYVLPQHRRRWVLMELLARIMIDADLPARASCTSMSLGAFLKLGFVEVSKSKNYTRVMKNA